MTNARSRILPAPIRYIDGVHEGWIYRDDIPKLVQRERWFATARYGPALNVIGWLVFNSRDQEPTEVENKVDAIELLLSLQVI